MKSSSGSGCAPLLFAIVDQQVAQPDDRVDRRPELVRHVRQEARLEFVGAPEVIGLLVELRVERDHASIGVFQLAIEMGQLLLLPLQFVKRTQQFLVLLLNPFDQSLWPQLTNRGHDFVNPLGRSPAARGWKNPFPA